MYCRLTLLLVALSCGGHQTVMSSRAQPAAWVGALETPANDSTWWESASPCPSETMLKRDAVSADHLDQCDAPYCRVWCERESGVAHGPETSWYRNTGKKHHEGYFRDGKRVGRWVAWYLGGEVADDGQYLAGEKNGLWQQWWEGGPMYRTVEFEAGDPVTITPYKDGSPLPTELVEVEGRIQATAGEVPEPRSNQSEPTNSTYLQAVLSKFPEAYSELSSVQYQHASNGVFGIDSVKVLVPEARLAPLSKEELSKRACEVKRALHLDCGCETVELAPATDYGWPTWPDKRVTPVTLHFNIAC